MAIANKIECYSHCILRKLGGAYELCKCKSKKSLSWGEKSGAKDKLAKRNKEIVSGFYSGEAVAELGKKYFLSEKRIQGIIREYEASNDVNRGFGNWLGEVTK